MVKKCLLTLVALLFSFSVCQAVEVTGVRKTNKRYVPPLQSNLSKNKPKLIKLLYDAGVENAEDLFSDPRLKLHYDFWVGGPGIPGDYPPIMTPESIARGKQKILENYEFLQEVEEKYGVPKEILISIFRIETNLGRFMGNYSVFNSLLTRAVSGTRRWKWAQDQLITFAVICKDLSLDPFNIPGSTHGAFGLLQFIPTSYIRFAVSWKGTNADLFKFEDAIASSSYYLQQCGWDSKNVNKQRRSIYAYNACTWYVNLVFRYAKAIKVSEREVMNFIQTRDRIREHMLQIVKEQDQPKIEDKVEVPVIEVKPEEIKVGEPVQINNDDLIDRNI